MSKTNNTEVNQIIKDLIELRDYNKEGRYFPGEMTKPGISIERAAKIICDQRNFINREMLANNLMVFYLTNTDVFNCIISEDLRDAIQWDDTYLDECAVDLAGMVGTGEVYSVPTGIFTAWSVKKETKSSTKLTLDEAFKQIAGYSISGI